MSDWDKKLRKASFRGVAFFVENHEHETGRRAVQYVFPARDKPFTEDLGAVGKTFTFEAYVIGADYFSQRDALIAACEKEGPGILVHPFLGTKNVQCGSIRIRENKNEGRQATFTLSFMEAGDAQFPSIGQDKVSKIAGFAAALKAISQTAFAKVFATVGFSQGVVDAARGRTTDAIDGFDSSTQNVSNLNDSLDDVGYSIRNLRRDTNTLAAQPDTLASRFAATIAALTGVGADNSTSLKVISSLATYGSTMALVKQTTPSKTQTAINQNAIRDLVQQLILAESANLAIQIDWPSFEDAQEQRELLLDVVEFQMQTTTDDDVFQALADLKGGLSEFLPDENDDLPRLRNIVLPTTSPSLVVVYDLFESPDQEADLIARNHIAHPGYVPGGVELEVLSE